MSRNKKQQYEGLTFSPRGEEQTDFVAAMSEYPLTVCKSRVFGTGKTYCAIGYACEQLKTGEIDRVIFCRDNSVISNRVGWSPGNRKEKLEESVKFAKNYFQLFLGGRYNKFETYIDYRDVADLAGETFVDSLLILDEAADCSMYDITMFLSRAGHGSSCVILGTDRQVTRGNSAFPDLFEKLPDCKHVALVELRNVLRNSWVGDVLNVLDA